MILLDSDHLSVLRFKSGDRTLRLTARLSLAVDAVIGTTIANVEESMRGWLAAIAKERFVRRQIPAYRELAELFTFFSGYHVALFEDKAIEHFERMKSEKIKVQTMDLKTASIALANDALLLTANKRDFSQVPGLKFANWMDAELQ